MVGSRHTLPSWISAAAWSVDFDGKVSSVSEAMFTEGKEASPPQPHRSNSDANLNFGERAVSAAGAAVLSAILVNPLDVVKTRLQAQAAGVPYSRTRHHVSGRMASLGPNTLFSDLRCSPYCPRGGMVGTEAVCPPDCFQYKGTLDVFYKIIRQEGFTRLWRGTNAGLALAIPTVGIYLPCYDLFRNWIEEFTSQNAPYLTPYVPLIAGSAARSLACISCYPIELARTRMQAFKEIKIGTKLPGVWKTLLGVLSPVRGSSNNFQNLQSYRILWTGVGAQLARDVPFSAICWSTLEPKDPTRALKMTTKTTLMEIWRDGGMKGLFTGVGPRVGRAGPSVGIVVSFYEVVKYILHQRTATS
ncbi:mitochondrial carrier protein MTM1-like isoform X2 [Macadamia integrifolia]|uniref:mitochondrial carrier protein MTM1-like isoform X2 n=1 Tax=Macadamia integrifolia TaxID=60698 RepID=UPI001C528F51|nr:mitochondrial carrier protein MTM1-like isoform X2 [Macadamia integrifolia]